MLLARNVRVGNYIGGKGGTAIQVHGCVYAGTWVRCVCVWYGWVGTCRYVSAAYTYGLLVRGYGGVKVHGYSHVSDVGI